jgi:hypothetical protein
MKRIRTFFIIFILIQIIQPSCKKFVSIDPPITRLVTSSVFGSDQTATAAMNGVYSFMQSSSGFASGSNKSVGFFSGLSSDELTNFTTFPNTIQFYQNQLSKANTDLYNYLWQIPYQCIYNANSILEGLSGSTQISPMVKQELTGESKFIRAFCNFYLTNLFGDIPLILTTDYKTN